MARVPPKTAPISARLAFFFLIAALTAAALACGSSEEDTSSDTTITPLLTPGPTPAFTPSNCPAPPVETPPPVQAKSYEQRPALTIDTSHAFIAHIYTTRGHFIVELLPKLAPEHVNSFVFLARERFFDGTVFHRVVPGFVAQGGDPTGSGTGGPGYTVPLEPSQEPFVRGVVGMARAQDPDSAGSQWFVTLGDAPHLDGQYTVFGRVTPETMAVVDCIQIGDAIISLVIQEL